MSLPIPPGTYGIDTMHSQVGFSVTHLGISLIRGTFDRYEGELVVGETLASTQVRFSAEMASVNSGNRMRDERIHDADYFDVEHYPTMTFRSTSITEADGRYTLTGELTIKGHTDEVSFSARFNGSSEFPMDGSTHYGFEARGTISRVAFGVSTGVPVVSDDVDLFLDVQFVAPALALSS